MAQPEIQTAPPRRRPKNRKDLILAAAAELFRERGYHGVSIVDIGQAVDISGPAVYRHFKSKEDLLLAAAHRSLDRINDAVGAAASGAPDERALDTALRAMVDIGIEDWAFTVVYVREARSIPSERRAPLERKRQALADTLRDLVHALHPQFPESELDLRMRALGGALTGSVLFGSASLSDRFRDVLVRLYHRLLDVPIAAAVEPAAERGSAAADRTSRREALLAAAVELMADQGYHDVYIEAIAEAAGITGPGLYRYFDTKQDILTAVFQRAGAYLAVVTAEAHASSPDGQHVLEHLVDRLVDALFTTQGLVIVYLTEGHNLAPAEREAHGRHLDELLDDWTAILQRARPRLDANEARILVQAALGTAVDVARRRDTRQMEMRPALRELLLSAALAT